VIECVVSGGQSGADQGGLRVARSADISTAGWAPRGWLAEVPDVMPDGAVRWTHRPCPWLADYGLVECPEPAGPAPDPTDGRAWADWLRRAYPAWTRANARDSDATLWLGNWHTAGGRTTLDACRALGRPTMLVYGGTTRPSEVRAWVEKAGIKTLNVAGNRESTSPGIGDRVEAFLRRAFRGASS